MTISEQYRRIQKLRKETAEDFLIKWQTTFVKEAPDSLTYSVDLQCSTAYDYDEDFINNIKETLEADSWYINIKQNKLFMHFFITDRK